ncbi:Peptidase S41 family protein ustP [Mycena venus]|uniref:Peptidase S41 family protein ustP n=1 Tax=Mycena venus TaxID=2733690 RepID=A0A8H6YKB2_9AGAR|nr:Peptidase S41 family protein ustP [Mycena venus]
MAPLHQLLALVSAFGVITIHAASDLQKGKPDPCAVIGGQKWVAPADVRACFSSFKVDPAIKSNILDVVSKTLAFHTSVNYQIKAPEPFTEFVHEDLFKDIERISKTSYPSDYDLHVDLSRTIKRLNDGHCVWINACYDSSFLNFLPIPLALLTEKDGTQNVHIVPEAFQVASAEFADEISVWQDALPGPLKGKLETLSGAKVLAINGKPPFDAVNANALITGSFQGLGTRQNAFFSSYARSTTNFSYSMGNFAQQSLPLSDSVTLVIQRVNHIVPEVITLPYRSRINPATVPFNSSASYRANNCVAVDGTNGVDLQESSSGLAPSAAGKFQQAPPSSSSKKHFLNVIMDTAPLSDVVLPPALQPTAPALNGSFGVGTFYMQKDGKTGVLALGSFSGADFNVMESGLLEGLLTLKSMGATQLIVDVTNNGGGFICVAHWLHRIIVGPKSTTVPEAGLDTKARDGPLARQIVQQIIDKNLDPNQELLYNPLNWNDANGVQFPATDNWLLPPVNVQINGHADAFTQRSNFLNLKEPDAILISSASRLGQECQPSGFTSTPPDVALFNSSKVVIVSNGRCASSCSLFSITMAKEEGVKTVVVGGKKDVQQEYCGTVGGQSTDYSTIDTEIKTAQLKNSSLAPPDLLVNGVQGITWRLGFGIQDTTQPEEWQDHPADLNLPLTPDLCAAPFSSHAKRANTFAFPALIFFFFFPFFVSVNNPVAIWEAVAAKLLV